MLWKIFRDSFEDAFDDSLGFFEILWDFLKMLLWILWDSLGFLEDAFEDSSVRFLGMLWDWLKILQDSRDSVKRFFRKILKDAFEYC